MQEDIACVDSKYINGTVLCSYLSKVNKAKHDSDLEVPDDVAERAINRCFWASNPSLPSQWGDPSAEADRYDSAEVHSINSEGG